MINIMFEEFKKKLTLKSFVSLFLGGFVLVIVFTLLVFGHFFFEYRSLTSKVARPVPDAQSKKIERIAFTPGGLVVKDDLLLFLSFTQEVEDANNWIHFQQDALKKAPQYSYLLESAQKTNKFNSEKIKVANSRLNEKNQVTTHTIVPSRDIYQLQRPLDFTLSSTNECSEPYCYQHRITFFELSPFLVRGLIGIEDERYLDHPGVDFWALMRALWVDLRALKMVQGGSTITQQIVKNLYLGLEKTFMRKVREIFYSFYFEWEYTKEDILELYFNEVYWGTLGGVNLKGVDAASHFYFQKTPQVLTPYEASILVSMLKGPTLYGFKRPWALRARADLVFKKLHEMGLLASVESVWNEAQWNEWLGRVERFHQGPRPRALAEVLKRSKKTVLNSYQEFVMTTGSMLWLTQLNAKNAVVKRGKDLSFKILADSVPCRLKDTYVLEHSKTDQDVSNACPEAFGLYSKIERPLEKALSIESHQVGSLLKPLIYRQFLILAPGKDLNETVDTLPITLNLLSGPWAPNESSKEPLAPTITLREALQGSRNIPLIRKAQAVGLDALESALLPYLPELKRPLREFPAQLLGSIELPLTRLAAIYESFIYEECRDLIKEKKTNDQSILVALSNPHATTLAKSVRGPLSEVAFFAKTGTSNLGNDNWLVAFDGENLQVLWVGSEIKEQKNSLELTGAWSAYKIYEYYQTFKGSALRALNCESLRPLIEEREQMAASSGPEQQTEPASSANLLEATPAPLIIPQQLIYKDGADQI